MEMVLQKGSTCMFASLAMVWNYSLDEVISLFGHDGTEIVFPDSAFPMRGIHPQEILDVAYSEGYGMLMIELLPARHPQDDKYKPVAIDDEDVLESRFLRYIYKRLAVLIVQKKESGNGHCVAWDGDEIFDPASGLRLELTDFVILEAWIFPKLVS